MRIHAYTVFDSPLRADHSGVMQELDPVFNKVARYFSLLSDPSRLKVIHAVCNVERSVNDVVAETELSQSTVSRHLAYLHTSGVATRRKEGARALYVIADRTLTDICRTACVSMVARDEENAAQLLPLRERVAQFMPEAANEALNSERVRAAKRARK
jgi:DNA-binding transcriptional ArsR family regulator